MNENHPQAEMSTEESIKWHVEMLAKLTDVIPTESYAKPSSPSSLIQPEAHVEIMFECLGWHEVRQNKELMEFFDVEGGRPEDPDEVAWCAIMIWTSLKRAGFNVPYTQNARALFKTLKELGDILVPEDGDIEKYDLLKGDIFGWGSHIASFAGYSHEEEMKATTQAEWEGLEDPNGRTAMVIGGNQSNQVNISPAHWYNRYSEFLGVIRLRPTAKIIPRHAA